MRANVQSCEQGSSVIIKLKDVGRHTVVELFCSVLLLAGAQAAEPGEVRLDGALGERFGLTLSNNVFKLDLERDFLSPFRKREAGEGTFVGLGKHADALVHFAKNSSDPAVLKQKDELIGFIVDHQLSDGYTGCLKGANRMSGVWDMHEMGFIIQALVAATSLMMDPLSLRYENGRIRARVTTNDDAVGVSGAASVEAELVPFADDDATLTYFRAPDIKHTVSSDDELLKDLRSPRVDGNHVR